MPAIFISYRRDDTQGEAGRLYDHLVQAFGQDSVFMDVTGIELGCDFRQAIHDQISTCDILLALIGKDWSSSVGRPGTSRLDDPKDFVRIETSAALKRGIPVVPVLLKGAKLPCEGQLPYELKELSYRNAIEVTHARWATDLITLNETISRHIGLIPQSKNKILSQITLNRYSFNTKFLFKIILSVATLFAAYFLVSPGPATREISFRLDPSKPRPDSVKDLNINIDDIVKIAPKNGFGKLWNCRGKVGITGVPVGFGGDNSFAVDENLRNPEAPFCSLIYSIGDNDNDNDDWRSLTDSQEFRADSMGKLYLTVNDVPPTKCNAMPDKDDCYKDNEIIDGTGDNLDITITSTIPRVKQILLFLGSFKTR